MQNAEINKIQNELVESRNRYQDLYDFDPIAYLTVDRNRLILEAKLSAATLLSVKRAALSSKPLIGLVFNHDADTFYRLWNPYVDEGDRPICYESFHIPPRDAVCDNCPTWQTLRDGLMHESEMETPTGDTRRNFRIVSSPFQGRDLNPSAIARG